MRRIKNFNYSIVFIIYVVFMAGICVGAAVINMLSEEICENLVQPFKNASGAADASIVFKNSMKGHIKSLIFVWLCGFTPFAPYCIIAAVSYKGGILGLFIGAMIKTYGAAKGAISAVCAVLPHNIIYLPVLFWVCAAAYKLWQSRQTKIPKPVAGYFGIFMMALIFCVVTALTDTYITSFFIKIIS